MERLSWGRVTIARLLMGGASELPGMQGYPGLSPCGATSWPLITEPHFMGYHRNEKKLPLTLQRQPALASPGPAQDKVEVSLGMSVTDRWIGTVDGHRPGNVQSGVERMCFSTH